MDRFTHPLKLKKTISIWNIRHLNSLSNCNYEMKTVIINHCARSAISFPTNKDKRQFDLRYFRILRLNYNSTIHKRALRLNYNSTIHKRALILKLHCSRWHQWTILITRRMHRSRSTPNPPLLRLATDRLRHILNHPTITKDHIGTGTRRQYPLSTHSLWQIKVRLR